MRTCVYIYVCVYTRMPLRPCAPLKLSFIDDGGLCQTLLCGCASFGCHRQILGHPVTPGVRVGTSYDTSTKTSLLLVKQTCAIRTASALHLALWRKCSIWDGGCESDRPSVLKMGVRCLDACYHPFKRLWSEWCKAIIWFEAWRFTEEIVSETSAFCSDKWMQTWLRQTELKGK